MITNERRLTQKKPSAYFTSIWQNCNVASVWIINLTYTDTGSSFAQMCAVFLKLSPPSQSTVIITILNQEACLIWLKTFGQNQRPIFGLWTETN